MYDAEGRRAIKTTAGVTVSYLYDLAARQLVEVSSSGVVNRMEVYGTGHLATYTATQTIYDHTEALGTERVRSNSSSMACETITNLPFGDGQVISGNCGDPSPLHFTGKQRDIESNLDYFGARYYHSAFGRVAHSFAFFANEWG